MNEKKKMFEVNVNVMVPENDEPHAAGGMSLEKALELVFDKIRPMVFAAVSGLMKPKVHAVPLPHPAGALSPRERG